MLGNSRGRQLRDYVPDYVVFDLETTGVSPTNDAIIEISAVKVKNRQVIDTFSRLVNPLRPIPYAASDVNNITDDMVCNEPDISEILPGFLEFIGDEILVGHNIANFDMKYIWRDVKLLYGKSVSNDYIDTLPMARRALPELAHHRLVDLALHYNISTLGAHRALNDCLMNQKCFEFLANEQPKGNIKKCPMCGDVMKKRNGRYGEFWGCSGYPVCKHTEN